MRITFHGEFVAAFRHGFDALLAPDDEILLLPDVLTSAADREAYARSEVIVGNRFAADYPRPDHLRLFHVPGAGFDGIDLAAVPAAAVVCNCFGHEQAIAEYVFATLLRQAVPIEAADAGLRQGDWAYWAGGPDAACNTHGELAGKTIGLVGYGHIGRAIAQRAQAFEMPVLVANRSPVKVAPPVGQGFPLPPPVTFWQAADIVVVSLPLTPETRGLVGAAAFAALRPSAVVINVGRGPVIDEVALFQALQTKRIAGAVIDTWYRYPKPSEAGVRPATLPFHRLANVVMTPHMSGWTQGTIRRRQAAIAANISCCREGRPCTNVVRPAGGLDVSSGGKE